MKDFSVSRKNRRDFLSFLAGSPLFVSTGFLSTLSQRLFASDELPIELISAPDEAINVFDFHSVAKATLPPAHYGYMASGTDANETLLANREGFKRYRIRNRRMVDVREIETSVELFGTRYPTPIALAPVGGHRAYHPEGELASARGAKVGGHMQILSTQTTTSVEEVTAARGAPIWYQLYPTNDWGVTTALVRRAEDAGCPVVAVTVDRPAARKSETFLRLERTDTRDCSVCHAQTGLLKDTTRRKPMWEGIDLSGLENTRASSMTWDIVSRLKSVTSMKVVLKGIVTAEDALLCIQYGVDGIIVSNHGGRAEASGRSTIESLAEVVTAVGGRIPVLIDSGFRRGTDVFKALALGADAVCVGRPYIWGLASFGQPGVEAALGILNSEFGRVMRMAGVTSIDQINASYIEDSWG